ncbi:hypothetical protein N7448_010729 [Penicillium atrosanguineum]|uniref:Uncharacterized protein n=1 Tax=Penicillium atrosanguineum TaxID=1132637 RepID=A0A9W9GGK5_9EURO|nr:uncharacterized protein N7443_007951 [Penicillium atrosanguineum]KAJ5119020.1 hypothetical protein N7526_010657 [Penicillium atrosanguineum]KAJ5120060.1 hypothetical protein N7448_010729 [Penicillium atrosanguineum]KAJ5297058.1 hypothetical protein N7443_007951 [Penicillium atrosanguineum]KAJ5299817.1 hypothetical protein N7476_011374 [Penicillium atrosanguineum]
MSWLFGSSGMSNPSFFAIHTSAISDACAMRMVYTTSPEEKNAPAPVEPKTQSAQTEKPKPCCVCKDEKTARDDCMLFSKSDDPQKECQSMVEKYKTCMAGFGFKV